MTLNSGGSIVVDCTGGAGIPASIAEFTETVTKHHKLTECLIGLAVINGIRSNLIHCTLLHCTTGGLSTTTCVTGHLNCTGDALVAGVLTSASANITGILGAGTLATNTANITTATVMNATVSNNMSCNQFLYGNNATIMGACQATGAVFRLLFQLGFTTAFVRQ